MNHSVRERENMSPPDVTSMFASTGGRTRFIQWLLIVPHKRTSVYLNFVWSVITQL